VQGKPKEVEKKSLVKKILCKRHNERLSILDDEAIKAFKIFAEERKLNDVPMRPSEWRQPPEPVRGKSALGR
jgi:hypothetical protein